MKDAMVDTQVLVYGTAGAGRKADDKLRRWAADSRSLLLQMEQIRVSTITVTEFLPAASLARSSERTKGVLARLHRAAFDAAAESVASKLIRKLRQDSAHCSMCLGVRKGGPCKECGNNGSYAQRLNDIYIAATAATADGCSATTAVFSRSHLISPSWGLRIL